MRSTHADLRTLARLESGGIEIAPHGLTIDGRVFLPQLYVPEEVDNQHRLEVILAGGFNPDAAPPVTVIWRWGNKQPVSAPIEDCLREFLKLADAEPRAVCSFVRRWGPLQYAKLDLVKKAAFEAMTEEPYVPHEWRDYVELPSNYLKYAQQFRALLLIASSFAEGKYGTKQEWMAACFAWEFDDDDWRKVQSNPNFRRSLFARTVTQFLQMADLLPAMVWNGDKLEVRLSYEESLDDPNGTLFQVLVMQLTSALTSGSVRCIICQNPFSLSTQPGRPKLTCSAECARKHHNASSAASVKRTRANKKKDV